MSLFYGLNLDEEQEEFKQAILSPDNIAVFCDSRAGTGKTTIALGAAYLLCKANKFNSIVYIVAPVQERAQGYLPGSIEEKSEPYLTPLYDAMTTLNISLSEFSGYRAMNAIKGEPVIDAMPHTFLRGANLSNKVIIIDEAQNFTPAELQKVLSRCHDDSKIVVIGHRGQRDIHNSGFGKYLLKASLAPNDFLQVCYLSTNYRGKFSRWADEVMED